MTILHISKIFQEVILNSNSQQRNLSFSILCFKFLITVDVAYSDVMLVKVNILLLGASLSMYESSCDLATPGSPIKQMLMLPIE